MRWTMIMSPHEDSTHLGPNYRFKHLACNTCRKRKSKCNGERPVCQTCENTGRDCEWEETLRKTGPRRGYIRSLEARLGLCLFDGRGSCSESDLRWQPKSSLC